MTMIMLIERTTGMWTLTPVEARRASFTGSNTPSGVSFSSFLPLRRHYIFSPSSYRRGLHCWINSSSGRKRRQARRAMLHQNSDLSWNKLHTDSYGTTIIPLCIISCSNDHSVCFLCPIALTFITFAHFFHASHDRQERVYPVLHLCYNIDQIIKLMMKDDLCKDER